jgi:tyrosyl-tRNA synthetase
MAFLALQIGGATALIGDPSGRSVERPHMDEVATQKNMLKLSAAVETFFERASDYMRKRIPSPAASYAPPLVMNNIEWFKDLGVLEFMRVVGTNARVNSMVTRERQAPSIHQYLYADVRRPAFSHG